MVDDTKTYLKKAKTKLGLKGTGVKVGDKILYKKLNAYLQGDKTKSQIIKQLQKMKKKKKNKK